MNFGMPGNSIIDGRLAGKGSVPVGEAQYLAMLAIAVERVANLIAYAQMGHWTPLLDKEIRHRLGLPPIVETEGTNP